MHYIYVLKFWISAIILSIIVVLCLWSKPVIGANILTPFPLQKPAIIHRLALNTHIIPTPAHKPTFATFNSTLSPTHDAELYRDIFTLQKAGKIQQADAKIAKLQGQTLMGHILYQRYMHPTAYRSSYEELHTWMETYADLPRAKNIYALAKKRRLASETRHLRQPIQKQFISPIREPTMVPGKNYQNSKVLSPEEKKNLDIHKAKANSAARAYYQGRIDEAHQLSRAVYQNVGTYIPKAAWIYGLTNWRKNNMQHAAEAFEMVADSIYASGWEAAGGAYWAARSHMRSGRKEDAHIWLERASQHPRTFYGLIATRALNKAFKFNWVTPTYTKDHYKHIVSTLAGERAIMLVNSGQIGLAEQELKYIDVRNNRTLQQSLLAYAEHVGMPGVSMRLGGIVRGKDGSYYDGALYPKGPWTIQNTGLVNQELVHALIRQESRFDPIAKSHSGAAGLMQIMPSTAAYVTGQNIYKTNAGRILLEQPEQNLIIGSNYLKTLSKMRSVDGNLFYMLIAYNAGPGNLAKWKRANSNHNDPLLFIETIPTAETRVYVERVLANYWIYRFKAGKDTKTLDNIAYTLDKIHTIPTELKIGKNP